MDGFRLSPGATVAVLGGGVAGLTAAHELAERGFSVTLYERRALGGKCRNMPVPGTGHGGRRDLRGLSYDHDRFGRVWEELVARAPHHRPGHVQALQYWCRKWSGSHELMCDFATRAMEASPTLAALPLIAALEGVEDDPKVWRSPMVRDALAVLLPRLAGEGAATKAQRSDRGLAIAALMVAKRHDEAVDQFRVLGSHADGEPWQNYFPNSRVGFLQARIEACKGARKPS